MPKQAATAAAERDAASAKTVVLQGELDKAREQMTRAQSGAAEGKLRSI